MRTVRKCSHPKDGINGYALEENGVPICAGCFQPVTLEAGMVGRCWECEFIFHWELPCRGKAYTYLPEYLRIPCQNCCDES